MYKGSRVAGPIDTIKNGIKYGRHNTMALTVDRCQTRSYLKNIILSIFKAFCKIISIHRVISKIYGISMLHLESLKLTNNNKDSPTLNNVRKIYQISIIESGVVTK